MVVKLTREETAGVTPEGMLSFTFLFPGQAQDSYAAGSKAYKTTLGIPQGSDLSKMVKPMELVEKTFGNIDPGSPDSKIFGVGGIIRKPEETGYKPENQEPFQGMYIMSFSSVVSQKSVMPKDAPLELSNEARANWANLSHPEIRAYFDRKVAERAPKVRRFPDLSNPNDVRSIEAKSQENVLAHLPAIPEADYHKTLLPVQPTEIWAGCFGQVAFRVYWSANRKPAQIGIALESVLLTRPGTRLVGETSPDAIFAEFAPPQDLAPKQNDWSNAV